MVKKLVHETHTLSYPKGLCNPEDLINFVPFPGFKRRWDELGLTDLDLDALKVILMINPRHAPIVKGAGGLRKIRFSPTAWNVGKSGALRIGYAYSEAESVVLLVTVYSKHDKAEISFRERREIKVLLREAWKRVWR